ncbi:arginine--tRNA ligase [Candidatus Saccharibacteria bacterium]|nr:arginine--tRNA ligase [Candidatus Saccharibacteria bacterium]
MEQKISQLIKERYKLDVQPIVTRPDEQFGDYSSNVALQLAGRLKSNPRAIADELAAALRESGEYAGVEVAGPGFLNIRLSNKALIAQLSHQPRQSRRGQKVVIETNNPNPFKAMHVGHGFNSILADTVANLLEASGAEVHRVSYHGDVGAHVGKSMWAILKYIEGDVSRLEAIEPGARNDFMSRMYAKGAQAAKADDEVKKQIDELAKQSFVLDDALYRQVYEICKAWSFEQIDATVKRLGCVPIERRYLESQADALGVETVKRHTGDVFIKSDGAIVFPGEQYGQFDAAFISSAGRGLYPARDLGLMQLKHADYRADKSYIVTAEEQKAYFKNVIKAAELCLPELDGVTQNISHGTAKLTTGKMSSRDGDVVTIESLFSQIQQAVVARGGEAKDEIVAGAMRYQFLKVKIGSDVIFDPAETVSLQGNTGSYLQYAHARAIRILEKIQQSPDDFAALDSKLLNSEERSLVRKLTEYSDVLERATQELSPHYVCSYLFELAQVFNRFYEQHTVVGSKEQAHRAALVARYAHTLRRGLQVLGIHAPDSM